MTRILVMAAYNENGFVVFRFSSPDRPAYGLSQVFTLDRKEQAAGNPYLIYGDIIGKELDIDKYSCSISVFTATSGGML
jgi:hypothetical protein